MRNLLALAILGVVGLVTACASQLPSNLMVAAVDPSAEEHRPGASGPVETISISTPDGEVSFSYEVIDGLAIFEGDMILGTAQELEQLQDAEGIILEPGDGARAGRGTALYSRVCWTFLFIPVHCENYRWPNATVPYTIKSNDWGTNTAMMRQRIEDAIAILHEQTAVRFVPRIGQDDYVEFKKGDGCSARVGRDGGKQPINLSTGCGTFSVLHEMLHALGLKHEHTRHDRNNHVVILWDNIRSGKGHNFETSDIAFDVFGYDFDSLMHYGAFAFCKKDGDDRCVGPTITRRDGSTDWSRSGLSPGDIATINRLYPGRPPTINITGPADGLSFPRSAANVFFSAAVSDPEGMPVEVTWVSNRDGLLGGGASLVTNRLSYGTHLVTATARDPQFNAASDTVSLTIVNTPPTVTLVQPPAASSFCVDESVFFSADVVDINQPGATLPAASVVWRVNGSFVATGHSMAHAFATAGSHTVSVTATDERGASAVDSRTVNISSCTNFPPEVSINQPATDLIGSRALFYDGYDEALGLWYKDIDLIGSATDPEDGALGGAALVWTTNQSSIQAAVLGTGTSLTVRLYSNECTGVTHQITLAATDSDGNTRTAARRIGIYTVCRKS